MIGTVRCFLCSEVTVTAAFTGVALQIQTNPCAPEHLPRSSGNHTLYTACKCQAEPRTLGYELSIADNDPLKIIIFERHASIS